MLRLLIYSLFSSMLFFWTTGSMEYDSYIPFVGYLAGITLLEIFIISMYMLFGKNENRQEMNGLIISAVLMNVGMSVNYRCIDLDQGMSAVFKSTYLADLILMLIAFILMYLIIRYTKLYRFKIINIFIFFALPVSVFGARISGRMTGGSYLYFAGFLIFGLVLMGFPFVAAWFMSAKENSYFGGKVGNVSWNLISFLLYTFLIYGGCVLCNEFGLLLVVGLTATVLFFIRCKDVKTKTLYTVFCVGGVLIACLKISHVWSRIQIWLDPAAAYSDENLKEKAESVLYLFRNIQNMGWWGKGIGNLSKRIYPTLNTDHALILLINDYSIFLCIIVIVLGMLFVRWMLICPKGLCVYDRYLNLASALIVCFIILIDVSSNLGSFITAGIGFPWISEGSSVNLMLTVLMAIHCGLLGKKVVEDA